MAGVAGVTVGVAGVAGVADVIPPLPPPTIPPLPPLLPPEEAATVALAVTQVPELAATMTAMSERAVDVSVSVGVEPQVMDLIGAPALALKKSAADG